MFWEFPLKIQAYDSSSDAWYDREFLIQEDLIAYIQHQWPEQPQFYKLKNTKKWKETGKTYTDSQKLSKRTNFEGGTYHHFTPNSVKHNKWKELEKARIINGVIYDGIYVPGFYYWYLNFCPIYDDLLKKKRFADVWDGDLWYMQHVMLCILTGQHVGGVKGRQKGYSYKHMAILYWSYCWFEASVNTVGAFAEELVDKSWRFLEGYRNHINAHTTWRRGPAIPKALKWKEEQMDETGIPRGLGSKLAGVTFKQRPDNDVGGSQTFFNYEEPGVSPTILETLEFVRPALEKGSETTGIIIACGSVGKLDDADGLKEIFYKPSDYNFRSVKNVWDTKNVVDRCCIFISEAYNMIGTDKNGIVEKGRAFMDEDGNSDVEFALKWIEAIKEKTRNSKKKASLKKLADSQKCTSPEQAFDERTVSEFPIEQIKRQQERILHKEANNLWDYKPRKGLLEEKDLDVIFNIKPEGGLPKEHEYPINPEWDDKRGVCTMYEPPDVSPEMYTYFACVDAVEVDETSTSDSVASLDIYKTAIQVTYEDGKGNVKTKTEGDKLVFTYRGRFKTAELTNHQMWLGIKLYNAFCYPERNKPNFINYMRRIGKAERHLARESDVPMFKDLNIKNSNFANNSKFGFNKGDNTEIWKHLKATAKEYFSTEFGKNTIINEYGEEEDIKIFTGIDRIDDYWLLEEFRRFVEGKGNYDRLVSFMGALFICKVYQQNRFIKKRSDVKKKEEQIVQKQPRSISLIGGQRQQYRGYRKPISML